LLVPSSEATTAAIGRRGTDSHSPRLSSTALLGVTSINF